MVGMLATCANACSTRVVECWRVDMWVGGEWAEVGGWYGNLGSPAADSVVAPADSDNLVVWLDHGVLPDGRYRLGRCGEVSALVEVDYHRAGPAPYFQRIHRDRNPYVCPHCASQTRAETTLSDVIHRWCGACKRFEDGCTRDDSRRTLLGHVPPPITGTGEHPPTE